MNIAYCKCFGACASVVHIYTYACHVRGICETLQWKAMIKSIFGSGRFLCAAPRFLLQDDELQDEFGCPAGPLHHHRVSTLLQQVHPASRQHLRNDRGSRDIHHLGKYSTFITPMQVCELSHPFQVTSSYTAVLILGLF